MRLLLVTDAYPPLIGGANRSAQLLAKGMTDRGHVVSVATAWQAGLPSIEEDGRIKIHRVRDLTSRIPWISADPYVHIPPPFPDPEAVWRFKRIVRSFRPDIVHSYGWLSYSCAAALLGSHVPLLLSARDYGNVCAVRTLMHNGSICEGPQLGKCLSCSTRFYGAPKGVVAVAGVFTGRALLRRKTRRLHSVSGYVQQVMHRHLVGSRSKIAEVVIPNFRPEAEPAPPDQSILNCLPSQPFILYVGAFRQVKGIDLLLSAYARLTDRPPMVLVGTRAPDSPSSYPNEVTVLFDVPRDTVMAIWDRALYGVAPSRWPEPLGNVVHEGMSRGKAIIGTRPGGHEDMIANEKTGLLVPAGDEDALVAAMQRLINDPADAIAMGKNAFVRSRLFTSDIVMSQYEELYETTKRRQTHEFPR